MILRLQANINVLVNIAVPFCIQYIYMNDNEIYISKKYVLENMVDVVECKLTMLGAEYRGYINITEFGKVCQQWGSSTPHISYFKHLADQKNYCRNPDHEPNGPWCYTIDPNVRWQYCDIPYCGRFKDVIFLVKKVGRLVDIFLINVR